MLRLAITLVHNKSNAENEAQISTILGLVDRHTQESTETVRDRTIVENKEGTTEEVLGPEYQATFYTYYYTFKAITEPHEVRFYHVVPHGKAIPSNIDQLDGAKVYYGPEFADTEKTYFDWGLKRGTNNGADVSIYVEDLSKLDFKKLLPKMEKVKDKQDPTEFLQEAGAKIANVEYFKKGGLR